MSTVLWTNLWKRLGPTNGYVHIVDRKNAAAKEQRDCFDPVGVVESTGAGGHIGNVPICESGKYLASALSTFGWEACGIQNLLSDSSDPAGWCNS